MNLNEFVKMHKNFTKGVKTLKEKSLENFYVEKNTQDLAGAESIAPAEEMSFTPEETTTRCFSQMGHKVSFNDAVTLLFDYLGQKNLADFEIIAVRDEDDKCDQDLVAAIQIAQENLGVEVDGIMGRKTISALRDATLNPGFLSNDDKEIKIDPSDEDLGDAESQAWSKRTGLGNPLGIDIITNNVNGQIITLNRTAMARYKKFLTSFESSNFYGHPTPMAKENEAFRVYDPKGGPHRSSLQASIHNYGNAIDIIIPTRYRNDPQEASIYIDSIVAAAEEAGFIRFGIGYATIHMDDGAYAGKQRKPAWWVYVDGKAKSDSSSKEKYINSGKLSEKWRSHLDGSIPTFDRLEV